ncbi:MAG: FkbM family methyltransferase [Actinomycetota bacterium]|nr:FkbM family methyltransferase [Actinomycetota bacterium]
MRAVIAPRTLLHRLELDLRVRRCLGGGRGYEPEMRFLRALCSRSDTSIDVGANMGLYTYQLRRHSACCHALEPHPVLAMGLASARLKGVQVHRLALSDRAGSAVLRVPVNDAAGYEHHGHSTIDDQNNLSLAGDVSIRQLEVQLLTLDDFVVEHRISRIGFMKVDVEGHELAVLRGGEHTLRRDTPNILVELEERHHPGTVVATKEMLADLGYRCFFLEGGVWHEADERKTNVSSGARSGDVSTRNFLFAPVLPAGLVFDRS